MGASLGRSEPGVFEILQVEDNAGDVVLTRNALKDSRFRFNLSVVENGEDALAFLRREGKYAEAPRPSLVLLDLEMPRMGGLAVLSEMKKDPELVRIPVLVFTSSRSDEDILRCYELGANAFIAKPEEVEQFSNVVKVIEDFWFQIAKLPPAKTPPTPPQGARKIAS